jgi:hypothetical protein
MGPKGRKFDFPNTNGFFSRVTEWFSKSGKCPPSVGQIWYGPYPPLSSLYCAKASSVFSPSPSSHPRFRPADDCQCPPCLSITLLAPSVSHRKPMPQTPTTAHSLPSQPSPSCTNFHQSMAPCAIVVLPSRTRLFCAGVPPCHSPLIALPHRPRGGRPD